MATSSSPQAPIIDHHSSFSSSNHDLLNSLFRDGENKMLRKTLVQQFEEVIEQMDHGIKKYYYIARETVPEIVAKETDPLIFLMVAKGDVKSGAERLANYWLNRHYFFGDRWLLPMTQTGTGCLSREDIEILRTGFITVVTLLDGRQLLVTDATRLQGLRINFKARERISYYLCTTGLNDKSRLEGVDNAILVSPKGLSNDERFPEMMKRLHTSLPMIAKSMVTIPILSEEGREHLVEYFSFLLLKTNETLSPETLAGCSALASREQALQRLEARGIKRIYLPEKAGGSSFFDGQLDGWIRMRLSVEDAMSSALPLQNLLPAKPDRSAKGLTDIIRRPSDAELDEETKGQFLRKRNAMYARRRTQMIKIQQIALTDQKNLLESENERLKKENQELELLLARAKLQITLEGLVGPSTTCQAGDTNPNSKPMYQGEHLLPQDLCGDAGQDLVPYSAPQALAVTASNVASLGMPFNDGQLGKEWSPDFDPSYIFP